MEYATKRTTEIQATPGLNSSKSMILNSDQLI